LANFSAQLQSLDIAPLRARYEAQGAFLNLDEFLPASITQALMEAVAAVEPSINRNYLPGHKQGGSVSRHTIDSQAPVIAELYRSPELLHWLEQLTGEKLQLSPPDDPHAYALYFYTKPGDHIGWHYDTSYYAGRRYTLLLGVIDRSSCKLDYELHTREPGAAVVRGSLQIPAGGLVVFDGDKLRHRITPLGEGEMRVSLTFEYVTDPRMHPWWRLISNMKDAFAYFGFRQVFQRLFQGRQLSRAATWLLTIGVLLFVAVLASQGLPVVMSTLARAGWGLLLVAAFHLIPLFIDAVAIAVLFAAPLNATSLRESLRTRWAGESANSLMPGGQIGGPVLMARHLARLGMPMEEAAAAITVSTTLQTFAQIAFAIIGVLLLGAHASVSEHALRTSALAASAFLAVQVGGFFLVQRRGFFSKITRTITRFSSKRDWSQWVNQAQAIDAAVQGTYSRGGPVFASFVLSLVGWFVGTGEVYLIALFLGAPVSWLDALLLESLGQAIRGAGFAIPGALGVQEAGYLLLAPIVGLQPGTAIALSLAKRTRELLLGLPGLLYLRLNLR
jgi:putative membrane protein